MKTVQLRFVKHVKPKPYTTWYSMQQYVWTIFGMRWKDIGFWSGSIGGDVWSPYTENSKKKLFKNVLEKYYEKPKSQINIIMHSQIKIL